MSEHPSSSPFINSANSQMYGKMPLQSWVGKVVSFDAQKDQIEDGSGWRYKVRILGDNSDVDQVKDDGLSYAICLLPTTAGSGAAYKLRSVRISQGDMVYGVFGGDGPRMILGVFPRTRQSAAKHSSNVFGTQSGFWDNGTLTDTEILSGEFNEQKGPNTPDVKALDVNKSNRTSTDPLPENFDLGTPITPENQPWPGLGEPITTAQIKFIISEGLETQEKIDAIKQGITQGLISEEVGKKMIILMGNKNKRSNEEAIKIGFPPPIETQ